MSRHNVRVRTNSPHGLIKTISKKKIDDCSANVHMFSKVVIEKQALRERYISLMNDAEKAVGRQEALYLLRDADIIWQKINSQY